MIYTLGIFSFIGDEIAKGFYGILLTLDAIIYSLISSAFKIFMTLASARLMSSDVYYEIANKIYVIIGVVMLFVLAYAILRAIINPDAAMKGDGLGPKTIQNVIIAVVGLAIAPALFNLMYQAQGLILEQDIIGKIFFRIDSSETTPTENGDDVNADEYVDTVGGAVTATTLWQAFFYPSEGSGLDAADIKADVDGYFVTGIKSVAAGTAVGLVVGTIAASTGVGLLVGAAVFLASIAIGFSNASNDEISLEQAYKLTAAGSSFTIYTAFAENIVEDEQITYMWGISTLVGAFALYAFISFSIDMGVRAAKLAYLQIIAPIPLILQVMPRFKDTFNKYIKSVSSTFLEVFIRVSVVYIVVFIICHLTDLFSSMASLWSDSSGLNVAERALAMALLILGLIMFAKQIPKLISETLGIGGGNLHLGIGQKLREGEAFSAAAVAGSGITSAVQGFNRKNYPDGTPKSLRSRAAAAAAGFGRATASSIHSQYIGPNRHSAQTFADTRNVIGNATDVANNARDEADRNRMNYQNAVKDRDEANRKLDDAIREVEAARASGDVARINAAIDAEKAARAVLDEKEADVRKHTFVGRHADNVITSVSTWATGTVDTSYEDNKVKLLANINDFKSKRESITANESDVRQAQQVYNDINAEQIGDYNERAYQAARITAMNSLSRASYSSDEAYELARTNAANSINREDYKYSDDEKAALSRDKERRLSEAKDALERTQDIAFSRMLSANDAKAVEAMSTFRSENIEALQTYANERVDGSRTIRQMIEESFGSNFYSGVNPDELAKSLTQKITDASIVDARGNPIEHEFKFVIRDGKATGEVIDVNNMFGRGANAVISQDDFSRRLSQSGVEVKTSVTEAASAAKKKRSEIVNSQSYQDAHDRKRKQQDQKKNGS